MRGAEEKQATDTNTKGVVGQTGNSKPIAPNPRNINPDIVSKMVLSCKSAPHFILLIGFNTIIAYDSINYNKKK